MMGRRESLIWLAGSGVGGGGFFGRAGLVHTDGAAVVAGRALGKWNPAPR